MKYLSLDEDLHLRSLSSLFPFLSALLIKAVVSPSKLSLAYSLGLPQIQCSHCCMDGEGSTFFSDFFSFIPGHLHRGRIKVVWVLGLRTANVMLHFLHF